MALDPALTGRMAAMLVAAFVFLVLASPAPAHAITRSDVIARAGNWVQRRVGYSRRARVDGYRRDCSGMVSMAWSTGKSYTSRSIASRATRIPLSDLQPGDAVLTPGHVEIFEGWANAAHTRFVALEESNRRTGAVRRVKKFARRSAGLRYRGITEPPIVVAVYVPPVVPVVTPAEEPPAATAAMDVVVPAAGSPVTPEAPALPVTTDVATAGGPAADAVAPVAVVPVAVVPAADAVVPTLP